MKIERNIITIQVSVDEWKQVKEDYKKLKYNNEILDYKKHPMLIDFIESIDLVNQNASHKIDRDLGTY
jgi:hypothetical protein